MHDAAMDTDGDGSILYILTTDSELRDSLIERYRQETKALASNTRVWAFPQSLLPIELPLREAEIWQWVQENVPALAGDEGARKEVAIRLQLAKQRLADKFKQSFDPGDVTWVQGGEVQRFPSARAFSRWLSELCDREFKHAPVLHNELLNREKLSSSAVAARRALLEAMLKHPDKPQLGIQKTPPELSVYRSMLDGGQFHTERAGQWQFGAPNEEWLPVWGEIHSFLDATRRAPSDYSSFIGGKTVALWDERGAAPPANLCSAPGRWGGR